MSVGLSALKARRAELVSALVGHCGFPNCGQSENHAASRSGASKTLTPSKKKTALRKFTIISHQHPKANSLSFPLFLPCSVSEKGFQVFLVSWIVCSCRFLGSG